MKKIGSVKHIVSLIPMMLLFCFLLVLPTDVYAAPVNAVIRDAQQEDAYTDEFKMDGYGYSVSDRLTFTDNFMTGTVLINDVGGNATAYSVLRHRSAIKFNITGIDGTITSAQMKIHVVDAFNNPVVNLISTTDNSWTQANARFPAFNPADIINGYSNVPVVANSEMAFNVTDYLQSVVDTGTSSVSFVLTGIEGGDQSFNFVSNLESTLTNKRPVLEITYIPKATSPSVTGVGVTNNTMPAWSWTAGGGGNGTFRYKLDNSDFSSGATTIASLSYTPGNALSEGAHTLYVQESNGATPARWSNSGSFTIVVDTTPPGAPAVTGPTATNDTTPTWTWSSGGGGGDGNYRYKLDDSDLSTGATATTSTSYTPGSALSDGTHTLYVQEKDTAGNWSSSGSFIINIDTVSPTLSISAPSALLTASGDITYTITYTGADNVTLADGDITLNKTGTANGTVTVLGSGAATRTVTIRGITGDGTLGITVAAGTASDTAGNMAVSPGASIAFNVDNTAPAAPSAPDMTAATDTGTSNTDNITKNTTPVFTGKAEAGSAVTLFSSVSDVIGTATADAEGNWSITSAPLANGSYTITATATDAAGNTSGASGGLTVTIDTTMPSAYALTITAGSGGSITTGSSGDYAEGSIITLAVTPNSGYSFNKWTSTGGGTFGNANSANTTYTMPAGAATITATFTYKGSGGGGGSSTPATHKADVSGIDTSGTTLPVNVNTGAGSAAVDLGTLTGDIFTGRETARITVPSITGVNTYTLGIPAASLSNSRGEGALTFSTETGSITIPDNMLSGISGVEGKKAGITIGQGDKSGLPNEVKTAIGDRPLVQLSLTLGGVQNGWNNPDAPVTVSIPYKPTATELSNLEHIVVWYIDGSGKVVSVPSGRYDPATGTVTFSTTHFSKYAVVYVQKTFGDLGRVEWARKPIEAMAAKGIINGTGASTYSPAAGITRADYLVLLVKTLGLTAEFDSNFDDVAPGAYYYEAVGIAKELGIAAGGGNNRFNPKENISRQDMMVLTARALEKYKDLKASKDVNVLDKFGDKGDIAGYAAESLATLVKEGLIAGSGDKLNPRAQTTRAEAAVFLYRIYNRS